MYLSLIAIILRCALYFEIAFKVGSVVLLSTAENLFRIYLILRFFTIIENNSYKQFYHFSLNRLRTFSERNGFTISQKGFLSVMHLSFRFLCLFCFLQKRQTIVSLFCVQKPVRAISIFKAVVPQSGSCHSCLRRFLSGKRHLITLNILLLTRRVFIQCFQPYITEFLEAIYIIYEIYFRQVM